MVGGADRGGSEGQGQGGRFVEPVSRGFRVRPRSVEPGLCSTGGNHGAGHMVLGDIQLLPSRRGQYGDDRTVRDARAERALATSDRESTRMNSRTYCAYRKPFSA